MKIEISDDIGYLPLATRSLCVMLCRENSAIWCVQKLLKMQLFSIHNNRTDFFSMIYYVFIFTFHPIKRISVLPLELKKDIILIKCIQKKWKILPALHHTSWSHCQLEDLHTISDLNFNKFISLLFIA